MSLVLLACLAAFLMGCTTIHQSDIAQQADTATTFTALELMNGFQEANPIVEPLLSEPAIGYPVLFGAKWFVNKGFRNAEDPRTCVAGIRTSTSIGVTATASNGLLLLAGPPGWAALGVGVAAGGLNAAYNDNFIEECRLQERFPWHDIQKEWENDTLYSNTENYIRDPSPRLAPIPKYFVSDPR